MWASSSFLAALNVVHAGKAEEVEVVDFARRDKVLAHLCYACVEMLFVQIPGTARRVADLT